MGEWAFRSNLPEGRHRRHRKSKCSPFNGMARTSSCRYSVREHRGREPCRLRTCSFGCTGTGTGAGQPKSGWAIYSSFIGSNHRGRHVQSCMGTFSAPGSSRATFLTTNATVSTRLIAFSCACSKSTRFRFRTWSSLDEQPRAHRPRTRVAALAALRDDSLPNRIKDDLSGAVQIEFLHQIRAVGLDG